MPAQKTRPDIGRYNRQTTANRRRQPINTINRQDINRRIVNRSAVSSETPMVREAEMIIRRMSYEERAAAGRKAKTRVCYIAAVAVVFLMAAFLIYRHTAIFGMNREINSLNSEYNNILVTNEDIQSNINKSVELGNLESVAKNELGMISPDSSQIFYIDMRNRDEVIKSGR